VAEHPLADGIILLGGTSILGPGPVVNAVVEKNRVTMHDSQFGGISLYGMVSTSYVGQNEILGGGAFALQAVGTSVGFAPEEHALSNAFVGNNIARFHATVADVFLDFNSESNTLVGNSGSVIDFGIDNRITGYSNMSGGVHLGQFQDVQAAKRAVMQS